MAPRATASSVSLALEALVARGGPPGRLGDATAARPSRHQERSPGIEMVRQRRERAAALAAGGGEEETR